MTLTHLRAFCSVVEKGSFRSAARQLDVAQSTLTQSIQTLEKELGVVLLQRSNQGINLTPAGEVFLARARSITLDCERALLDLQPWKGEPEGHIALGVTSEPLAELLLPVLSNFTQRFPRMQVHVASGTTKGLVEKVRDGRLDFVLCPLAPNVADIDLAIDRLYSSNAGIIARKGHPQAHAKSVQALTDCQWISVRPAGVVGGAENRLIELFRTQGLAPPKIAISTDSLLETLHIVSETDYLTIEPRMLPGMKLFSSALTTIAIEEPLATRDVCLISRRSSPLTSVSQELTSMLISYSRLVHRSR